MDKVRHLTQLLFTYLVIKPVVFLIFGVRISAPEDLPKNGPAIIAANHGSHLDTLVLLSLLRPAQLTMVHPVAAKDYFGSNLFTRFLTTWLLNAVFINRNVEPGTDPLQPVGEVLKEDHVLLFFPEGTRGKPGTIGQFKTGINRLVERHPQVSVHPIYLQNSGRSLPKGKWIPVPYFVEVYVGSSITDTDPEGFHQTLRQRIVALGPANQPGVDG